MRAHDVVLHPGREMAIILIFLMEKFSRWTRDRILINVYKWNSSVKDLIGLHRSNNDLKLKNWTKSCSEYPIAYSAHLHLCSAEQANNWHLEMGNLALQACRLLGQRKGRLIWFVGHLKFTCRISNSLTTSFQVPFVFESRTLMKQN